MHSPHQTVQGAQKHRHWQIISISQEKKRSTGEPSYKKKSLSPPLSKLCFISTKISVFLNQQPHPAIGSGPVRGRRGCCGRRAWPSAGPAAQGHRRWRPRAARAPPGTSPAPRPGPREDGERLLVSRVSLSISWHLLWKVKRLRTRKLCGFLFRSGKSR